MKEYLYIDGFPFRIISGNHRMVYNHLKNYILPLIDKKVFRILLVDELNDKYYHYEYYNGEIKRINSVCFSDFDKIHHLLHRDLF